MQLKALSTSDTAPNKDELLQKGESSQVPPEKPHAKGSKGITSV